ncbi:helix-turn-helix transcriptional regulator [Aquibium sp. LZ166]|uniref:Helix-turn-helix transcriptional regulator n=1 Tax=Aquibium pacificus TaxID=3153579 RepID=A0ABV3SEY1_9HYPH
MTAQDTGIHESESNIFTELGLPDADRHFLKAQLVAEIFRLTKAEGLTQAKAASRMGISQPEVSRLFRGHFREYSVERLLGFLTAFDRDVEIIARPTEKAGGQGSITFRHETA